MRVSLHHGARVGGRLPLLSDGDLEMRMAVHSFTRALHGSVSQVGAR